MTRRELILAAPALALEKSKLDEASALIRKTVESGDVRAAGLEVRENGQSRRSMEPDKIFLLASITKPMTATGVMVLVDRRELSLSDPVSKFFPRFTGEGREKITVRHLLTHTSGLPDM